MLQALIRTCFGVRDDSHEQNTPSQALLLEGVLGENRVSAPSPAALTGGDPADTPSPHWAALAAREEGQTSAHPHVLPKLNQM